MRKKWQVGGPCGCVPMWKCVQSSSLGMGIMRMCQELMGCLLYEEHLEQCLAHWKHSLNVTHCNDDEDVTQSERTKSRVQSSTYYWSEQWYQILIISGLESRGMGWFRVCSFLLFPPLWDTIDLDHGATLKCWACCFDTLIYAIWSPLWC